MHEHTPACLTFAANTPRTLTGGGKTDIPMKRLLPFLLFCLFVSPYSFPPAHAGESGTAKGNIRNIILMIPDGCSTELLAVARWMNRGISLSLDTCIRGLVKTHCSDSPIGDSAPTGSAYATGHRSQDGFVSTYPARSMKPDGSRFLSDSAKAFRPMMTLMEAAKLQGKATGIVASCHFPHATPAAFLAHTPDRNQYFRISKQMTAQACDILFGGGSFFVDSSQVRYGFDAQRQLRENGIFYTRNFEQVRQAAREGHSRIWGLFASREMAYEIDRIRETPSQPSLETMTRQALEILSKNPQGFFLMVEGSKIDWGAHNNDLPAAVFDLLAFDQAVGAALDFAREDGETLVVILPDHQTGGPVIGGYNLSKGYARTSVEEIFGPISRYRKSASKAVSDILSENGFSEKDRLEPLIRQSLERDFGICETEEEEIVQTARTLRNKGLSDASTRALTRIINRRNLIGWSTYGHHGGDVFFACYHPDGREPNGLIDNEAIAPYICREAGLGNLDSLSRTYYVPATEIFSGKEMRTVWRGNTECSDTERDPLYLEVRNVDGKDLKIYPNTKKAVWGRQTINLPHLCIYNGKGFYLPLSLGRKSGMAINTAVPMREKTE